MSRRFRHGFSRFFALSLVLGTSSAALAQTGGAPSVPPAQASPPATQPASPSQAPASSPPAPPAAAASSDTASSAPASAEAPTEGAPPAPAATTAAPAAAAPAAETPAATAPAAAAPATETPAATAPPATAPPATTPAPAGVAATESSEPSPETQAEPAAEVAPPKKPKPLQFAITWDLVVPIRMPLQPASAGFFGGVGYQAFSLDVRYWIEDRIAIGGMVGWHTLNSKGVTSFEGDDAVTQTGTTYMEASVNEFLGRVHYAMADRAATRAYVPPPGKKAELGKQIIPMIALGAGPARFVQTLDTGLARTASERWMVAIVPELGIELPTKMLPVLIAARLHYLFGSSQGPEELYATFSLGGAFE